MLTQSTISLLLISLVGAAPTAAPNDNGNGNGNGNRNVLSDTLTLFSSFQQLNKLEFTGCNLANVAPPLNDTSVRLSAPETNGTLEYVGLGRGTQNYSCADDAASTAPTAIGAAATLFDISCVAAAAMDADFLSELPVLVSRMPVDAAVLAGLTLKQFTDSFGKKNSHGNDKDNDNDKDKDNDNGFIIAEHFFTDPTTPTFDFRPFGNPQWLQAKKLESVNAPTTAVNGSVAWLKLGYKTGTGIHQVYRVLTAGGNPPATCEGQQPTFEVDYAGIYFFYS